MKRKFIWFVSGLCLILFFLSPPIVGHAKEVKKLDTEIGIDIEKSSEEKEEPKKPSVIDGGNGQINYQLLPKTGELLSTLIVILLGISLLIFSLGVLSIKRLYQTTSWEV